MSLVRRLLAALPVLLPVGVAGLSAVVTACLLLDVLVPAVVLPVGLVVVAVVVALTGLGPAPARRSDLVWDALALLLAAGFVVVTAWYSSQNVVVGRDPGVYALAAHWLLDHSTTDIPIDGDYEVFGPGFNLNSAGFARGGEKPALAPQGMHALPGLLATAGELGGVRALFRANALLGGLGVLAVYGFARLLVRRWLALGVAVVLAASLPQSAFSRDTYTEPLAQLVLFGGLAVLWQAWDGPARRALPAGLAIGAGALARVDGLLVVPPLLVLAGVLVAAAPHGARSTALRRAAALLAGVGVSVSLALLDVKLLAPAYYSDLRPELSQVLALSVVGAAVAVLAAVLGTRTSVLHSLERRTRRARPAAAAGVVLVAAVVLASRPLWLTVRSSEPGGGNLASTVAGLQEREGLPLDPARLYWEQTVTWLSWYVGPVAVALGFVGLAVLVHRAVREPSLRLLPFVGVLGVTAAVYLARPTITPDHVWAMRRFLPLVLPGLLVCVAVAADEALRRRPGRLRGRGRGALVPVAVGVVGVLTLAATVRTTAPFATVREGVPQIAEIDTVCRALPDDAAVALVGRMKLRYVQTVRSFCGVPAAAVVTPGALASAHERTQRQGRTLFVLSGEDTAAQLDTGAGPPQPLTRVQVITWVPRLEGPPSQAQATLRVLSLGRVGPDGVVQEWVTAPSGTASGSASGADPRPGYAVQP